MRKWLSGVALFSFLLCLCTKACAVEPPAYDYEGFAAYLQEQGFAIPQTLEEAIGDEDFNDLPKFELIVDEENDQYILRTDLGEADAIILLCTPGYTSDVRLVETDETGVYVAKGIGDYTILRIDVCDERNRNVSPILCHFSLDESGRWRCFSFSKGHWLTDTIFVKRDLASFSDGTGSFSYTIGKIDKNYDRRELELTFRIPTEKRYVDYFESMHDRASTNIQFHNQSVRYLWFDDYYYDGYDWTKDGDPCDPPFEITPELYPYPSFVP